MADGDISKQRTSLDMVGIMQEAWQRVSGCKMTFFLCAIIAGLVHIVLGQALQLILGERVDGNLADSVVPIFEIALEALLTVGFMNLGLRRMQGAELEIAMFFDPLKEYFNWLVTGLLYAILVMIGLLFLVIPGIYLAVACYFWWFVVLDRTTGKHRIGIGESLEISRKLVTPYWFGVFFTIIATSFITFLSLIPLGIGLIWTLPWGVLVVANIYLHLTAASAAKQNSPAALSQ